MVSSPDSLPESRIKNPRVSRIIRLFERIAGWQGELFSFLLLLATAQVCFELVLRYVFNSPTVWGLEVTIFLCGIVYVMSGAYAERHNSHIKVDVFYDRWSPRTQALIDIIFADMALFLFSGVLVWQGWIFFWKAITQGQTSGTAWDPIVWPVKLTIVIGSLTLLLTGVSKFIRDVYKFRGSRDRA